MADIDSDIVEITPVEDAPDDASSEYIEMESVGNDCGCQYCQDGRQALEEGPETYEKWKRQKEEERKKWNQKKEEMEKKRERRQRIEKPWLYETQYPMTRPPDINYREIIIDDQDRIDRLLEREDLHFTERCLRYQEQDAYVEYTMLRGYESWAESMLEAAKNSGDNERATFFQDLYDVVAEDSEVVRGESCKVDNELDDRHCRRVAKRLGIPANHEDWTTEDRQRFYEDDEYIWVRGWPIGERQRFKAAQQLGISENPEEWTTEDRQRFYEDDEYIWVRGWPNDEREQFKAARKLGIPPNPEEWTTEDRQQFYEDDKYVVGWPTYERTRFRTARKLWISENHEEWTIEDKRRYVDSGKYVWLWEENNNFREELENIDREALVHSSKDEQEAQSEEESSPPTGSDDGSINNVDLQLGNMDEAAPTPSEPESERDVNDNTNDHELEANTADDQSSSPPITKFRLEQGDRYYHPLAAILLILLLNEFAKQQLHL